MAYTKEELLTEYFEDAIEKNPGAVYQWANDQGATRFVTNDPNVNAVEEALAQGDDAAAMAELDRWEKEALANTKARRGRVQVVDNPPVEEKDWEVEKY